MNPIIKTARKSSYKTRQLLAFLRKSKKVSTNIDILVIVDETIAFLLRSIDKSVEITYTNDAKATKVYGDDSLIKNALINMGINTWHAMPNGGSIPIVPLSPSRMVVRLSILFAYSFVISEKSKAKTISSFTLRL